MPYQRPVTRYCCRWRPIGERKEMVETRLLRCTIPILTSSAACLVLVRPRADEPSQYTIRSRVIAGTADSVVIQEIAAPKM